MRGPEIASESIDSWLNDISSGKCQLPEFQRDVVWDQHRVCDLVEAVIRERPAGCLLLLPKNKDSTQQFKVRAFKGTNPSQVEYSHLVLDGQQRLTALWRALTKSDDKHKYFLVFNPEYPESTNELEVRCITRKQAWIEDPIQTFERGLVPLEITWTDNRSSNLYSGIMEWFTHVERSGPQTGLNSGLISAAHWTQNISEHIRNFRLPYIQLPEATTKMEAIDTFIETNTSSQKLRKFDIVVGELLRDKEGDLRTFRERIYQEAPHIEDYLNENEVGDLILKTACLSVGLTPTEGQYSKEPVLEYVANRIDDVIEGISWSIHVLRSDSIYDKQRLPSVVPLRVLPALFQRLSNEEKSLGTAKKIARAYMWRSFATDRYGRSAATRLKEDYDALCDVLQAKRNIHTVPIWDSNRYPVPDQSMVIEAGWPQSKSVLARTILAVTLRQGAKDISSDFELNDTNVSNREYHHIFPKKYLNDNSPRSEPNRAVNCVLIDGKTNKKAAAKAPIQYFGELCRTVAGMRITQEDIRTRLESHLVPNIDIRRSTTVKKTYDDFCRSRARQIKEHLHKLVEGQSP